MNVEVQHWIKHEGLKYIKELGIVGGQVVVDFGCSSGHYTIPAAKVVGSKGTVYAIDREKSDIDQLMKKVQSLGINNIVPIISSKLTIDLPASSVDAVLIYDVLHYLNDNERKKLYQSVNIVLKDCGILSVFPKHNRSDSPMWHLAELRITDIVEEIERNHFLLVQKDEKRLMHDEYIDKGVIINFKKSPKKRKHKNFKNLEEL
jgi:ubiquinone/menaquinone biosynthesis C-methylase UbiE